MRIVFIDTSILCNFIDVPGKNQELASVRQEFRERTLRGDRFVLPITSIIETGNHIEQLSPARRDVAERYAQTLREVVEEKLPWVLNTADSTGGRTGPVNYGIP